MLFNTLGIDTSEVLAAAGTKWNFLPSARFGGRSLHRRRPVLPHPQGAGVGYHPEVILADRRINDRMGAYVADQVVRLLAGAHRHVAGARVLVLGLAFKENCPDLRNTRVVDIVTELAGFGTRWTCSIRGWMPTRRWRSTASRSCPQTAPSGDYDAVVLAVARRLLADDADLRAWLAPAGSLYDVKAALPAPTSPPASDSTPSSPETAGQCQPNRADSAAMADIGLQFARASQDRLRQPVPNDPIEEPDAHCHHRSARLRRTVGDRAPARLHPDAFPAGDRHRILRSSSTKAPRRLRRSTSTP